MTFHAGGGVTWYAFTYRSFAVLLHVTFSTSSCPCRPQKTASLVTEDVHGIGWSTTHFDISIDANRACQKASPSIWDD